MSIREPKWLPRPTGVNRPDDPILTMTAEQKNVFLEAVWYSFCLTGMVSAPIGRALADRRRHPRAGDLVIIPDAMSPRTSSAEDTLMGVGYLVGERWEPAVSEEAWAEHGQTEWDGYCPETQAWYVQYDPRATAVCRWENADCLAVPRGGPFADEVKRAADKYVTEVRA